MTLGHLFEDSICRDSRSGIWKVYGHICLPVRFAAARPPRLCAWPRPLSMAGWLYSPSFLQSKWQWLTLALPSTRTPLPI